MDREAKDQYLLVIQAKDMVGQNGGLSGTTSVTRDLTDVNDNPPLAFLEVSCSVACGKHAPFPCRIIGMCLWKEFSQICLK